MLQFSYDTATATWNAAFHALHIYQKLPNFLNALGKDMHFPCYKDNTTLFFSSIQILATVQKMQIMNRFHIQVKSCLNKTA